MVTTTKLMLSKHLLHSNHTILPTSLMMNSMSFIENTTKSMFLIEFYWAMDSNVTKII